MKKAIDISFFLCALSLAFSTSAQQTPNSSDQYLVGLWGSERVFGPWVTGSITVDGRKWVASISGFDVRAQHSGSVTSFVLPGGQGSFRGVISGDGETISGWWTQPTPSMSGWNSFSGRVILRRSQNQVWQGTVLPLRDSLALYLDVQRAPDGTLTAFFRNPETDMYAHSSFVITSEGKTLTLTSPSNKRVLQGSYDKSADRVSIQIPIEVLHKPAYRVTFDFTRRSNGDAPGFFPRIPATNTYSYPEPVDHHDGWVTGSLRDGGLSQDLIEKAVTKILQVQTTSGRSPDIQGLLVARHGKLILEEYFYGFDGSRPHDLRSAGKSFTSALVGIAIDHGAHFGLHTPVLGLFPEYKTVANLDPRKQRITVENLLSMTSGLACDDGDEASPGNEETMYRQSAQPDFYKFVLDLRMATDPDSARAVYCTGGINLLAGIVHNTTGSSFSDYFERFLARPLNFGQYYLDLTPTGDFYGGGGLYLLPRDALKFGELYLDQGQWNRKRLLSKSWIAISTQRHSSFSTEHGYGFGWHVFTLRFDNQEYPEYEAEGNGGQVISVIPKLDLAVVFTTGNYSDDMTGPEREILADIVAAVKH
jgi:CubicO group peptidase (beta-lactamase class C family)